MNQPGGPVRLRGTSVVAAPLALVGVAGLSLAVATAIWGGFGGHDLGTAFWATLVVTALVGAGALLAVRGCFVEVEGGTIRDVVGWVTRRRLAQADVERASVRRGPWRVYDLELRDGSVETLIGASPLQFPARLLPDAVERDLEDLHVILGRADGAGRGPDVGGG